MARAASRPKRDPVDSLTASLHLRGQEYAFQLYTRPLRLGEFGTVQYYWMDGSQFRKVGSAASMANFRSVVGFWAAAMHEIGAQHDLEQQIHYVLAVCYPLVSSCKSLQDVFRDAYLAPGAVDHASSLHSELRERVNKVVESRDRFQVQAELDQVLGRFELPSKILPLFQDALRHWVGKGVALMRERDNAGLEQFVAEVDYWIKKYRKRSNRWVRQFINLFGYESKAAFYTCYANAWAGLIAWLQENRGLDPLSARFLGFWHNQNQPIEVFHGQTKGGILYPTQQGMVVVKDQGRKRARQSITIKTERIGPNHVRDVFSGQVLSLHPLSGFFMKDPALCAIAGRFFTSKTAVRGITPGQVERCGDYWDLVGAILGAAHLYRQALDRQADARGVRQREGAERVAAVGPLDYGESSILEAFAEARQIRCPACGGKLIYDKYHPAEAGASTFQVEYTCNSCKRPVPISVDATDFVPWLRSGD